MLCVLNVGPAGCGGLGRARLGTDAEDSFFPGTGDTHPHLNETHASSFFTMVVVVAVVAGVGSIIDILTWVWWWWLLWCFECAGDRHCYYIDPAVEKRSRDHKRHI